MFNIDIELLYEIKPEILQNTNIINKIIDELAKDLKNKLSKYIGLLFKRRRY